MPDHVAFAGGLLQGEDYRVSAAASGVEALRFLKSHRPDLIVLDIRMDDMDGLEVCRRIKSAPETQDIPVIFVTAEPDSTVITQGLPGVLRLCVQALCPRGISCPYCGAFKYCEAGARACCRL